MEIVVNFKNGSLFSWKNVRTKEVDSVFVDVRELARKIEEREARKNGNLRRQRIRPSINRIPPKRACSVTEQLDYSIVRIACRVFRRSW
jgi:hypothetical protein